MVSKSAIYGDAGSCFRMSGCTQQVRESCVIEMVTQLKKENDKRNSISNKYHSLLPFDFPVSRAEFGQLNRRRRRENKEEMELILDALYVRVRSIAGGRRRRRGRGE